MIADAVKRQASEAFHAYEKVLVDRIVRRPGWRLDATPLYEVLDSNDEAKVLAFIDEMRSATRGLDGIIV